MIVVADASPLHYLILVDQIALLERLYGSVFVPEAVAAELRAARAPDPVRAWIVEPPSWVQIVSVSPDETASVAEWLDAGERAAIALAERVRADLILIDDADGKAEAARRKFRVTGTLGVLRAGADEGLIDVRAVLTQLARTTFYTDQQLVPQAVREVAGEHESRMMRRLRCRVRRTSVRHLVVGWDRGRQTCDRDYAAGIRKSASPRIFAIRHSLAHSCVPVLHRAFQRRCSFA